MKFTISISIFFHHYRSYSHLKKLAGITTSPPIEDPIEKELRKQKKKEEEMLALPKKKRDAHSDMIRTSPPKTSKDARDGRVDSRPGSNAAITPSE